MRVGRGGSRAPGTEGLAALSPREREIADLVAQGLTNREIGARLFLSEKTIETHLTRVFQKLGLRSRTQVAAEVSRPA
jgi:DNA-binding NarL/FixJ family response regulator